MSETYYEKLAKLAINYSIKVKTGDRIVIMGPALGKDLFLALQAEILKAGGHEKMGGTIHCALGMENLNFF